VVEQQHLLVLQAEGGGDRAVRVVGAPLARFAGEEDGGDGLGQLVAVVLARDEHLVVLAAELLHVGPALEPEAHIEHGLQPLRRVELARALRTGGDGRVRG